mgnify:CR=1 FL=1
MSKPKFIVKIEGKNYPFRGFDISAGEGGLSMEIVFPPISDLISLSPLSKAEIYMQHNGKTFKLAYGYLNAYSVYKSSQDFSVGLQFVSSFDLLANLPVVLLNVAGNTTVDVQQITQYSKFFSGLTIGEKSALQAADVFNTSEGIKTVQDKLTNALTVIYNWYDNNKIKELIDNFKRSLFTPTYASVPVELASINQLFMLLQNMASFTTPTIGDIVNSILEATGYRLVFYPFCRGDSQVNAYLIGTNNLTMPNFTSGKSPNYIPKSLVLGFNSSTSYNAPTRMLVEAQLMDLNIYMTYPSAPSGEDKKGVRPFITSYTFPQIASVAETNNLGTAINALAQRQFFEETSKYSTASADIVFWPFVYPGRGAIIEVGDMKLWGVVSQVEHRFDVMTGPITRVTLRAVTPYTSSNKWQGESGNGVLEDVGTTNSAVSTKASDSGEKSTTTIETEVTDPAVVSAYMALLKIRTELENTLEKMQEIIYKYSTTLARVERQRLSLLRAVNDVSIAEKATVTVYDIVDKISIDTLIKSIAPDGNLAEGNIRITGKKDDVAKKFQNLTTKDGKGINVVEKRGELTAPKTASVSDFANSSNKVYNVAIYHYDPWGGNNERLFFIVVLIKQKSINYLLVEVDPKTQEIRNRFQAEFKELALTLEQAVENCDDAIKAIDSVRSGLNLAKQYKAQLETASSNISQDNPNKSKAQQDITNIVNKLNKMIAALEAIASNLENYTMGLKMLLNIHATSYDNLSKNIQNVVITPNVLFINFTDLPSLQYNKVKILEPVKKPIEIGNVKYTTYDSGTYQDLASRFVKSINNTIINNSNSIISTFNTEAPIISFETSITSETSDLEKSLNTYATYKKTISVTTGTTKTQNTSKPFNGTKKYNIGLTATDNGYSTFGSYESMLSQLIKDASIDVKTVSDFTLGNEPAWSTQLIITNNELQTIEFSYYRFF